MAMDQLGMKVADVGFQTANVSKSGNQVGTVSDDFRNLLNSKQEGTKESQDSSQVSKDTKPEKTDEVKDEVKTDGEKGDEVKTEKPEEDTGKTDEMLAAYQASQSMRPEILMTVPEPETAEAVPDMAAAETGTEVELAAQIPEEVQDRGGQMLAGELKGRQANEAVKPAESREADLTAETGTAVKAEEITMPAHTEGSEDRRQTSDFAASLKHTEKTPQVKEDTQVQSENFAAEHAAVAASSEAPRNVYVEKQEYTYAQPTTIHVEQPEELPEKVTDQLLAKLAEGVKEFEIHIEPANLGKIAVKILYEGTQAHVSIICSEKRALDVLGQNARDIGNVLSKNFGGETTIIVDKQETDYLNQTRDENEQANQEQQKQKENSKNQDSEDAEQFLQKLRLGLVG